MTDLVIARLKVTGVRFYDNKIYYIFVDYE